jgi:hypothetical protein
MNSPAILRTYVQTLSENWFRCRDAQLHSQLFLCYPLSMLMNYIPYDRLVISPLSCSGTFLLQFLCLGGYQLITSLLVQHAPRSPSKTATRRPLPLSCCTASWATCRQYVNYLGWDLDFTGTQMVLLRNSMIAFNLYDGLLEE